MAATSSFLDQIQRDNALRQHPVAWDLGECTDKCLASVLQDIKLVVSDRLPPKPDA